MQAEKSKSKSAPRSAGKRKRIGTHVKYRNRMYAAFSIPGRWGELGRKLRKLAEHGGLRP
jgi:hypothetical protein